MPELYGRGAALPVLQVRGRIVVSHDHGDCDVAWKNETVSAQTLDGFFRY